MGLFHADYQNPSDPAMEYLQQVPEVGHQAYDPYIAAGKGAGRAIAPEYYQMATDPIGYHDRIMSGYTESPDYQYRSAQVQKQMDANAAAGGYTGTEYDINRQGEALSGMLAADQRQYYQDTTESQQYGLAGGQHFFDVGYGASGSLANMLSQNLAAESGLAYQGANWENQMQAQRRGNITGGFAQGLGYGMYV